MRKRGEGSERKRGEGKGKRGEGKGKEVTEGEKRGREWGNEIGKEEEGARERREGSRPVPRSPHTPTQYPNLAPTH